ncbi:SARP family transcriptional regulator [Oscillatoria sp. FACHB-1407]|uniref:BTAD domain-containing putative transcriptional regulator n=1 Tax=Oscillatoria sp. FACHB-1407 TaxID=2692847 RepID=UPI001687BA52|nr:BTAD domain-containing putative transcriptional regulator [Oscillatoria sp. FACHB-1407]MBD2463804.1 SARP family transcriptional regulator [Oscillatoria sp. FACHB-1407]
MTLSIELLGYPRVVRDAVNRQPRGRKSWCLLAYLLLANQPISRERLAELLFPAADDPLGALRWSLSDLRRVLGSGCQLSGDPLVMILPSTAVVDVDLVCRGRWDEALELRGLGQDLLAGVSVSGSAAFELWLFSERHRLNGATEAILHEATLACLAEGRINDALKCASRLVDLNPLDEAHHILLVQCLRTAGDYDGAAKHAMHCTDLFRQELGAEPSPVLQEAIHQPTINLSKTRPYSLQAMLEAGEAAIAAGAISQGLQTLREAATLARQEQNHQLLARVLAALGHALVHVGRGSDEEGGAALHEAVSRAIEVGDERTAAIAYRELAFADLERGRYHRALELLGEATRLAAGDDAEMAWIECIEGACLNDQGCYSQALAVLRSAVQRAERTESPEALVFARCWVGRLHLLRGEFAEATSVLERALQEAHACWMALAPLPESLLAEVHLLTGDLGTAASQLERAFVMGRQLDDPCLESIAMRGLGLVAIARGQISRGYQMLIDAPRISRRLPDSYRWIEAYGLDALCRVAIAQGQKAAPRWIADLESLAARCGMRELVVRALLHKARLGEPGAFETAHDMATAIDNPFLHSTIAQIKF